MWRKDEPNKPQTSPDPLSSSVPIVERPTSSPPVTVNEPATVSHGIRIKGEISGRGDLYWDGVLEGKIRIDDGNFTIGRNARINADIEAREIIVHGEVNGGLKGERVQVMSTGKVSGDMETRGIIIEDGAVLRSKVHVLREDEPRPSRAVSAPRAKEAVAAAGAPAKEQKL